MRVMLMVELIYVISYLEARDIKREHTGSAIYNGRINT